MHGQQTIKFSNRQPLDTFLRATLSYVV